MSSSVFIIITELVYNPNLLYNQTNEKRYEVRRVRTRIVELMAKKQAETRRIIDQAAIIEATGLSRPTIKSWIDGTVDGFRGETIVALCTYFDCDVGDLLTIHDAPDDQPEEKS